jgi:hypothetical protein
MMNTHIRDNLLALLTIPLCKMTKAATQAIPNTSADTLLALDTSVYDTDGMVDTANNRININTAGKYMMGTSAVWATEANGWRISRIKHVRGGTTTIVAEVRGVSSGNNLSRVCTTIYDCLVGDRLQMYLANNATAATVSLQPPNPYQPMLWAFRVGT